MKNPGSQVTSFKRYVVRPSQAFRLHLYLQLIATNHCLPLGGLSLGKELQYLQTWEPTLKALPPLPRAPGNTNQPRVNSSCSNLQGPLPPTGLIERIASSSGRRRDSDRPAYSRAARDGLRVQIVYHAGLRRGPATWQLGP